jgi:hemoglobin/transferrin/lactoferrin receptor protein
VIRGLSSNRILVLVDGQRLNNSRESTEFAGIQPSLVDLSQVERIEVLRGPGSVLYGSDAIGGVINIITKQAEFSGQGFTLGGAVNLAYGTAAQDKRGGFELSGADERYTFRLSGSAADVSNYSSAEGEVPNSGMEQRDLAGSMRFLLTDRSFLRAEVQLVQTRDVGFPGYDPATSGVDISFPKFDRNKLAVGYDISDWAGLSSLALNAYYQDVAKESKRNLAFGPYFFLNNYTTSDIGSLGLNAQGQKSAGSHRLTFGVDAYQDELHDETFAESPFGSNTEVAVPDSRQRGIGLYFQDEVKATDRLQLSVGIRGDNYTFVSFDDADYTGEPFDVDQSAFSGSLAARYQLTQNVSLNALVGRAFRAPNIQERSFAGLASTGDTLILQNPDLSSETSLNVEAGFKVRYARYAGGMTIYQNRVKDLIGLVFLGEDPASGLELARFENIEEALIEGVEFELEAFLSDTWTAFGNVTYTRGTDQASDQPLSFIPPVKGVLGVRFQQPRWWSETSMRAVDNQDRVPTLPEPGTPSPGFTVFDLRGGFDISPALGVVAAVENFTDKAYREPFNNRLEPGRNFKLSFNYRF